MAGTGANIEGQRTTADSITEDLFARSIYPDIWNPEEKAGAWNNTGAAIPAILNGLKKKRSVKNYRHEQYDDSYPQPYMTINNGNLTGNTLTLTVDDATPILDHDAKSTSGGGVVLHNPRTRENMLCTATNLSGGTATVLQVIRNYGDTIGDKPTGTTNADQAETHGVLLVDGDYLLIGASSFPEGSKAPNPMYTRSVGSYNYTEIIRVSCKMTHREMATAREIGGKSQAYQRKKKAEEWKIAFGKQLYFGNRSTRTDASTSTTYTQMGGIFEHMNSGNNLDISGVGYNSGTLTERVMDEWAEMTFENGSDLRYVPCSLRFINGVGSFVRNVTRVDDNKTSFGTKMKEWTSPMGGTFRFVAEPKVFGALWTPAQGSDTGGGATRGTALALDLELLEIVYFDKYDVRFYPDIEHDDHPLAVKDEWLGDVGLCMRGYGLDNTSRTTAGPQRSPHTKLLGFSQY